MKKIRMIVSAVVVFAIVGGALAFKSPELMVFKCIQVDEDEFQCDFVANNVQSGPIAIQPADFQL